MRTCVTTNMTKQFSFTKNENLKPKTSSKSLVPGLTGYDMYDMIPGTWYHEQSIMSKKAFGLQPANSRTGSNLLAVAQRRLVVPAPKIDRREAFVAGQLQALHGSLLILVHNRRLPDQSRIVSQIAGLAKETLGVSKAGLELHRRFLGLVLFQEGQAFVSQPLTFGDLVCWGRG